ncbi:MAG: adenylate/guanylate cyclase domain-containing protein [Alphaproteobacteria bacterium]|nr:adenylate/guanylate cyclase domain-containing protein [Alphaproteobacteria bacterium]
MAAPRPAVKPARRLLAFVFGEAPQGTLPAPVQRDIARQQHEGEIVVGWVQLAAVAVFGLLYGLSPKTFGAGATFAPVPWVLALYAAFTLCRLAWAYRGAPPHWFLAASVILDIALLMGLIWSFHLQYQQPPAFYLKAPTLLYVFIFIALRALRFSPFYVFLAGGSAALGWLAMVAYAVADEPHTMLTRDYVCYMTSASVLIGAEFDKIVSILVVTAILAVAIVRARRLLLRSVSESTAAALSRFFAPEVASHIRIAGQSLAPGTGEVREAAVLFCDVKGFTMLAARLEPDAVMRLLADYQTRLDGVIRRAGGSIGKFLGDGIMATFGATTRWETWAASAQSTAWRRRWRHGTTSGPPAVRRRWMFAFRWPPGPWCSAPLAMRRASSSP